MPNKQLELELDPTRLIEKIRPTERLKSFEMKVSFKMTTTGFDEAIKKLKRLSPDSEFALRLLRAAVIRALVVNIRRRFLANMERAVEMQVEAENGRTVQHSPRQRIRDMALKTKINAAMDAYNEAQVNSDYGRADQIRSRLQKYFDELHERLQQSSNGTRLESHHLSVISGNRFRRQMLALMEYFTDALFVASIGQGQTLKLGIGPKDILDRIETPSATEALTGRRSTSRYKSFWRHLEFGTGVRRRAAKDRRNLLAPPPAKWWYGPENKMDVRGLWLKGTAPMSFLTDDSGNFYAEDLSALSRELTKELDRLLTS